MLTFVLCAGNVSGEISTALTVQLYGGTRDTASPAGSIQANRRAGVTAETRPASRNIVGAVGDELGGVWRYDWNDHDATPGSGERRLAHR